MANSPHGNTLQVGFFLLPTIASRPDVHLGPLTPRWTHFFPAWRGVIKFTVSYSDGGTHSRFDIIQKNWIMFDCHQRQLCDLELIMNGGFSPLDGFMNEADYKRFLVLQNPFNNNVVIQLSALWIIYAFLTDCSSQCPLLLTSHVQMWSVGQSPQAPVLLY